MVGNVLRTYSLRKDLTHGVRAGADTRWMIENGCNTDVTHAYLPFMRCDCLHEAEIWCGFVAIFGWQTLQIGLHNIILAPHIDKDLLGGTNYSPHISTELGCT